MSIPEEGKTTRRNGRQPGNEEFMYQFFVEDEQIANDLVIIEGSDVNHIRNVLRMKCGEKVRISSTSGRNFFGTIDRIAENVVEVCITEETALDTELPCRICLFQGLPKSDKMELIVQKAVELGAAEVIPVAMKNCVVKLDAKKAAAKKTGARALRSIIEEFMMDIMYEIPKDEMIGKVIITKDYIEGKGSPTILMRSNG